jgi:hypothetical protein
MLAAAALAASACSAGASGGAAAGAGTAAVTGRATAVTAARARQVFASYVSATARALAAGDEEAVLARTAGAQQDAVREEFRAAAYDRARPPSYRYGTPVFYRPAVTSSPLWFLASVPVTASTAPEPAATAGARLGRSGTLLMAFVADGPHGSWLLASSAQLAPGQSLPALATTGDGEAEPVPMDDAATLGEPQVVGPLQAAVVDDGPASAASRAVAAGPLTTGMHAYLSSPPPRYAAPRGDVRQFALEGSDYDSFALRTANGGALVLYTMYLDTVVETPSVYAEDDPVLPGPPIAIPPQFAPLLPPGTAPPKYKLTTQLLLDFAAVDPPAAAAGAKISVIAVGGGPNWAST